MHFCPENHKFCWKTSIGDRLRKILSEEKIQRCEKNCFVNISAIKLIKFEKIMF